jgi:LPXTG-motif cell wall-anchored protein
LLADAPHASCEVTQLPSDMFAPHHNQFSGHFDLPAGTTGTITVTADAHWKGGEESSDQGSDKLPPADKCAETSPTTSTAPPTTAPPTTAPPTSAPQPTVAPSTSLAPSTTDDSAVGGATSTTSGGGQLPFTGASSGPMLLAGVVLIGGGALVLFVGRNRSQTR